MTAATGPESNVTMIGSISLGNLRYLTNGWVEFVVPTDDFLTPLIIDMDDLSLIHPHLPLHVTSKSRSSASIQDGIDGLLGALSINPERLSEFGMCIYPALELLD